MMERVKILAFALYVFILVTACASNPTVSSPANRPEPAWHWEWARSGNGGTPEQFAVDKYACLQDYRQTASPFVQRDKLTEMQFMTMHQQLCLESKGWKKAQNRPSEINNQLWYWRPNGWVAAPPGTKKIDWVWQGSLGEEADAIKRFSADKEACMRDMKITDPYTFTDQQGQFFMKCMWTKKWGQEPTP